jgi:hypothetical protein
MTEAHLCVRPRSSSTALLHLSHGATVDLESKGADVTGGVMKAVLHLLSAMAVLYVCLVDT